MASRDERAIIVEGLAAVAVALAEMGATEAEMQEALERTGALRRPRHAAVLGDVVAAISALPQPLDEPADELERAQPLRDLLGLASLAEELAATLHAREWVQHLADDLDARSDE